MSAPDSRPALPIHLPFDSISPSFSKNSPCVFLVLGYYLTSLGEMPCGWLLCAYFEFVFEVENDETIYLVSDESDTLIVNNGDSQLDMSTRRIKFSLLKK